MDQPFRLSTATGILPLGQLLIRPEVGIARACERPTLVPLRPVVEFAHGDGPAVGPDLDVGLTRRDEIPVPVRCLRVATVGPDDDEVVAAVDQHQHHRTWRAARATDHVEQEHGLAEERVALGPLARPELLDLAPGRPSTQTRQTRAHEVGDATADGRHERIVVSDRGVAVSDSVEHFGARGAPGPAATCGADSDRLSDRTGG